MDSIINATILAVSTAVSDVNLISSTAATINVIFNSSSRTITSTTVQPAKLTTSGDEYGMTTSTVANTTNVAMSWLSTGRIQIPLYGAILCLAVVGNILVILTLVQNRRMRTITNVFLLNLAISDMLLGVLCMPFTLIGTLLRDFVFGEAMCKLLPYLQGELINARTHIMHVLAFDDRCVVVVEMWSGHKGHFCFFFFSFV